MPEVELPAIPAVVPIVLPLVLPVFELAFGFVFLDMLEDDRWLLEGVGWLAPDPILLPAWSIASANPVEVEEVFETTEAVCCRRALNSRVKRLT